VKVSGYTQDIWGNRYPGGGTYHFWIAERMTLATGTFQGMAYPVGNRAGPPLSILNCAKWPNPKAPKRAKPQWRHQRRRVSVRSQNLRMCREFLNHRWFLPLAAGLGRSQNRLWTTICS